MGRAAARKRQPPQAQPERYAGGVLDDLLVVMPYGELGYSRYHMKLTTIADYGWLIQTGRVISQTGSYPHQAAQDLFTQALKIKGWKRLLMLEHDHEFPPNVFRRHAQYTEPIVAGVYILRDIEAPLPVMFKWDVGRNNAVRPNAAEMKKMIDEPGLYPMDLVPMGCTSIAREVLENWPRDQPFFTSHTNFRGSTISHDVFFCRVAQDNGYEPYIDTRLQVSHFVMVPLDIPYFVRWWNHAGADRAIEEQTREALSVVQPSDGTKQPKIVVPYVEGGLTEQTKAAVEATGLGVLYDRMQRDDSYHMLVAALWHEGRTFVTVEQDIVPEAGQIEDLLACSEPWCAYKYDYPPFGKYAGMGCAKFSAELMAKLPDALAEVAKRSDEQHPSMHWCRLDAWLREYLEANGMRQHLHGVVAHLHKGHPAHDCAVGPSGEKLRYQLVAP